jgi:hypothetical protein
VRAGRDMRPWVVVGRWQAGPATEYFNLSQNFKTNTNFVIQFGDLPDVQNSLNFAGQQIGTKGGTLLFGSSSKSRRIASYKFWDKLKFESSMKFILYLIINLH